MTERTDQYSPADQRSTAELISELSNQVSRLVRDELQLAVVELRRKGKRVGTGAGLFGGAGLLATFGGATLVASAVLALSLVLDAWLAALIVGAVLLLGAGLLAVIGRGQLRRGVPPVPERAVRSVKQDIETVKEHAHR